MYHTPLTLRSLLKPHKFKKELKIPMPPPKTVLKLENIREKGIEVEYPTAPWYQKFRDDKLAAAEAFAKKKKTKGELLVPKIPADRHQGSGLDKPRMENKTIVKTIKFSITP